MGMPSLRAAPALEPIQIDGQLTEAGWRDAAVASDFTQNDPREGAPASERTEVRVIYTPDALVIGAMLYDSYPVSTLLVPVLLASVQATRELLMGDPMQESRSWMVLLAVFDVIFFVAALFAFEHIIED